MVTSVEADVVVVGAGLAGLSAALGVADAGQTVVVLEASGRVGGRTFSGELMGAEVDWGGEWVGKGQPRIYALIERLGLRTFPTYDTGYKLLELRGKVSRYKGTIPWMAPWKLLQIQVAIWLLDAKANKLDLSRFWEHPNAALWDATTLDAMRRKFVWSADARATMDAAMRTIFGAESGDLSLLHALAYVKSASGLNNLIATEGGFQHDRIAGGAQAISLAAAAKLEGRVHLEAPVTAIDQGPETVTVTVADGRTFRARRVIVAVPVPLAGRIAFTPRLPSLREQLVQRSTMGAAVKCFVRYERPFWRDAGMSGEVASGDGPISVTFDQCSEDGKNACLLAFVGGAHARTWHTRPLEARKQLIVDRLTRYFGDEASRPIGYAEQDWSLEPWIGGGPIALFPTGTLSVLGSALRAPVGRVHWAGTETAEQCMGFMEGAVASGDRAAAEVLAALGA
jgi:monoamine oxidase